MCRGNYQWSSVEKAALKDFTIFTGKDVCVEVSFKPLGLQLLKRGAKTGVFL